MIDGKESRKPSKSSSNFQPAATARTDKTEDIMDFKDLSKNK